MHVTPYDCADPRWSRACRRELNSMFQNIQQYELIEAGGVAYRPRAYGDPQPDGTWDGWVVFFPLSLVGTTAIAPPGPETTQSTLAALGVWAAGLTPVYLEGALARALPPVQPPVIPRLKDAEYESLDHAERMETAAAIERTAADLDEAEARMARADAEVLRRERLAVEGEAAAIEEEAAKVEANMHEEAARDARAIAADAKRRRRSAQEVTRVLGSSDSPSSGPHDPLNTCDPFAVRDIPGLSWGSLRSPRYRTTRARVLRGLT